LCEDIISIPRLLQVEPISVGSAQVGDEGSNVTARSQEFAGGFVDFPLGRGAPHPR
jgi:hypothetical protein